MNLRCLALTLLLSSAAVVQAGPRDDLWKAVADAEKKGLPKTAIKSLEPIIAGAIKDKNHDEALKAIAKKIALETPKSEERIVKLKAEMAKAPAEMKPMMEAVLAHWYWNYFRQNRWRFMQRTHAPRLRRAKI